MKELKTYRPAAGYLAVLIAGMILFVGFTTVLYRLDGVNIITMLMTVFSIAAIAAVIDSFRAKIEPNETTLTVRHNFRTLIYEKEKITDIKKDGGKVYLKSHDDEWLEVPDLGQNSQSVFNTLRGWLERE
ncbi:MAG: hypothetical protein V7739_05760 [Motiliproteus sp.]